MKLEHFSQGIRGALAVWCLAVVGTYPTGANASCGQSPYLGSICMTAAEFCPQNYASLDGELLPISDHQALSALLGCKWGGDCRSTFALPDLRGRTAMGSGQGPGLTVRNLGSQLGTETQTLQVNQLASHNHTATLTPGEPSSVTLSAFDGLGKSVTPSEANSFLQTVGASPFAASTDTLIYGPGGGDPVPMGGVEFSGSTGGVTIANTGTGAPFSILNPMTVLNFCIATQGIFPPRP